MGLLAFYGVFIVLKIVYWLPVAFAVIITLFLYVAMACAQQSHSLEGCSLGTWGRTQVQFFSEIGRCILAEFPCAQRPRKAAMLAAIPGSFHGGDCNRARVTSQCNGLLRRLPLNHWASAAVSASMDTDQQTTIGKT